MKHCTSLLLLCLYVTANLCFASITDGDCAIARIPQMPSPQPAFKLRLFDKQFPRHNTLNKGTKSMPSNSRLKSRECNGKFFNALLFGGKHAFYPSEDVEEHPGVKVRFK